MEQPIISIKGLGKKYDITHQRGGYVALRDVLASILRRPFSYLKHKTKQLAGFEAKEEFWALRDINLDIKQGEIIGIIGANGAGKSTLLKILTGITPPTEGEIVMRGRIASLLEVGTGFHPELTGRENIFLNGAILGMKGKEIAAKFDEIVAFAGVEKFLDTPVKYYSSGMYVRLAFSVAAHMEPDILLVDEVLAVGDAEFQKKCLGKMEEVTRQDGRTIIFVSHNLTAVKRLCTKTALLQHGKLIRFGETSTVLDYYLSNGRATNAIMEYPAKEELDGQIMKVSVLDNQDRPQARIPVGENFSIEIEFVVRRPLRQKMLMLHFFYEGELLLFSTEGDTTGVYKDYAVGTYTTRVEIPAYLFQIGGLSFVASLKHLSEGAGAVDATKEIPIEITNEHNKKYPIWGESSWGKMSSILSYKTQRLDDHGNKT